MKNPHMLYRCPGPEVFEGIACETTTVEAEDVAAHLEAGWSVNWIEADAYAKEAAEVGTSANAAGLHAVHKGRGVWEVQDAQGNAVQTGLTKEQAKAAVA